MNKGDVIQFNENHKWCGIDGIRYLVYVEEPTEGRACIFVMSTENAIEYNGKAKLVLKEDNDE